MPGPIAVKLRLREERGLTHKEAAQLANVSHWTLSAPESGMRDPYMPTVTKIARAYGVSVEELVEEEWPPVRFPRLLQIPPLPAPLCATLCANFAVSEFSEVQLPLSIFLGRPDAFLVIRVPRLLRRPQ